MRSYMAMFWQHSLYVYCIGKGQGTDKCVTKQDSELFDIITLEQLSQLSTPMYKLRKEKEKNRDQSLVEPSSVTVLAREDSDAMDKFPLSRLNILYLLTLCCFSEWHFYFVTTAYHVGLNAILGDND